jgi:presenilin-like A22 family membrane protease
VRRPSVFLGLLLGGLIGLPFIGLAYLGRQWVGLPFIGAAGYHSVTVTI